MKPCGPIPPYFGQEGGWLTIGGQRVDALMAQCGGTPLFVYDGQIVLQKLNMLRAAMPADVAISYAIKANPFPPLLSFMAPFVDGMDVASEGELALALQYGAKAISLAGPGKGDAALRAAITAGAVINLESEGEARRALALADAVGVRPRLAIRINPDFGLRGSGLQMGGGAKPFGVDADRVPALVQHLVASGADWVGFHIFAGSQSLDAAAIIQMQQQSVRLAGDLAQAAGHRPRTVNLGGGFGVPYAHGDIVLDIERIGSALARSLEARGAMLQETQFSLELGRYLVAECGVYLARIMDRKISYGKNFLIVDGGLHHQLAASGNFGMIVRRNYPVAIASRAGVPANTVATIVGCLCTPLDRLADEAHLPDADEGDIVAVFLAGAYGATASPAAFLGHGPAREHLVGAHNVID